MNHPFNISNFPSKVNVSLDICNGKQVKNTMFVHFWVLCRCCMQKVICQCSGDPQRGHTHTPLQSGEINIWLSTQTQPYIHVISSLYRSLSHTKPSCVCLRSPYASVMRCDLAYERLYLWEHLYSPGGETVTRGSYVSLFTVNSKSNKNKPHIICFMKL